MFEANPTIKRLSEQGIVTTPLTYNGVIHRTGSSLLVGLVWLYIEMLRLLSKLRSRN
jgi:uncharacterized YccA/Bax inhibitor family protein